MGCCVGLTQRWSWLWFRVVFGDRAGPRHLSWSWQRVFEQGPGLWTNDEPLSISFMLLKASLNGRLEEQPFISHSSGSWGVRDQGLRFLEVSVSGGGELPSWLGRCRLLTAASQLLTVLRCPPSSTVPSTHHQFQNGAPGAPLTQGGFHLPGLNLSGGTLWFNT